MSGAGGRAVTADGATSFSCADGPLVAVAVTADRVMFTTGVGDVAVAAGTTAVVGPYEISVLAADGTTAWFDVAAP